MEGLGIEEGCTRSPSSSVDGRVVWVAASMFSWEECEAKVALDGVGERYGGMVSSGIVDGDDTLLTV